MRYLAIAAVLLSFPAFMYLLRTNPAYRYWAYAALGILPFGVAAWNLDAGLISWAAWPGYAKGMVLTVQDSLALAIVLTMRQPRGLPPLIGWLGLYMVPVALSIATASMGMAAFFYLFQLMRLAVVMIAVAKVVTDPRGLRWLGMGLACAMILEGGVTIMQKLQGGWQTPGTMEHQNQLGMMLHLTALPVMGMLLAGYRSWVLQLSVAMALIAVVFGASRATIGFIGLGIVLVLVLSMIRQVTPHKTRMVGMIAMAMVVASPFMLESVAKRLAQEYEYKDQSYDERGAFEKAAKAMWSDHPMGVGANNYVLVANEQGYSLRAGVAWNSGSRATNVHNTYLLIAAETGWAGLLSFMALMGAVMLAGWRFAFAKRRDPRGDIALGCTVGFAMMALHGQYEWITLTYQVQYMIAISMGIISGLVRQRAMEKRDARRERLAASAPGEPLVGQPVA